MIHVDHNIDTWPKRNMLSISKENSKSQEPRVSSTRSSKKKRIEDRIYQGVKYRQKSKRYDEVHVSVTPKWSEAHGPTIPVIVDQ